MLRTIDLNDESRISAQEIEFHSAPAVEHNGKVDVQLKSSARLPQRFQPSIEECLGRTSRAFGAFGFWRNRTRGRTNKFASGVSTPSRTSRRTLAAVTRHLNL